MEFYIQIGLHLVIGVTSTIVVIGGISYYNFYKNETKKQVENLQLYVSEKEDTKVCNIRT